MPRLASVPSIWLRRSLIPASRSPTGPWVPTLFSGSLPRGTTMRANFDSDIGDSGVTWCCNSGATFVGAVPNPSTRMQKAPLSSRM